MQVTEAPVSTNPRAGMPSIVSWPEMGGPTAHPIGATLALGDPPKSLNAPEESPDYRLGRGAPGFVPWVGLEPFPVPVVAAGVAVWYGQGSDRRSGLPRHKENIEEASYLAAASGHENKIPLPHNQSMEGDQGYTGVVVP